MKLRYLFLTAALALLLTSSAAHAQQLSDAEKEVWQTVETYTKRFAENNVDGMMSYFHKDFTGWGAGAPVPSDFATRDKWVRFFVPKIKVLFYDLQPLAIKVHGDVAIVHYISSMLSVRGNEAAEWSSTNWTDILKKDGGKWMLIGDHGTNPEDEDDD